MKITFYGAAKNVTGSCYMIDTGAVKFLVDCGLFQGTRELKERNYAIFPFKPEEIAFVVLTHAHIDHSGLIPKLYKHGFSGPVIATKATVELCGAMLPDSGFIQEMEVERKNRKNLRAGLPSIEAIYTAEDAQQCLKHFKGISYDQLWEAIPDVVVRFKNAGHILGSAIAEIWVKDHGENAKLVFSGDLGSSGRLTVNNPSYIEHADYLVVESTYGSRTHAVPGNRRQSLARVIQETFQRGGNVIIPAFAIERTQDLLLNLHHLIADGKVKGKDIYIDSPLAITATEIFCRNQHLFSENIQGAKRLNKGTCPLYLPGLQFSRTADESRALNKIKQGAIIISASGMADAGRVKHHLRHNLWREESSVVFIGYQAPGTLGRRLIDGEKQVKIHGESISVRAQIVNLEGYSAHADQKGILDWVSHFKYPPERIFITHGEADAANALAELLRSAIKTEVTVPDYLNEYRLKTALKFPSGIQAMVTRPKLKATMERIHDKITRLINEEIDHRRIYELYNLLTSIEKKLNDLE